MSGPQFSSRMMLLAVAAASVGLAVLVYPLPQVAHGLGSFLWVAMLVSVLAVVYRRGATRAFWLGFAIFGFGKKLLVKTTLSEPLLTMFYRARRGILDDAMAGDQHLFRNQYTALLNVGDALESMFLALAGGAIAVYLYRTQEPGRRDGISSATRPEE